MATHIDYKLSPDTDAGPSPAIWADCDIARILRDPGYGYMLSDDFISQPSLSDGDTIPPYGAHVGSGCSIAGSTSFPGGAITLVQDGTDNDEVWLASGGNIYAPFLISDTAGSDKKLWFEARLKVSTIADDVCAMFVGLAEEAFAADNAKVDDTGVLITSKDMIGFDSVHVNGGTTGTNAKVNFVYQKASQGLVTKISTVHTFVADTFVKLGFVYDPDATYDATTGDIPRIKAYVNGTADSTYITATNIATSTFPDGEELTPVVGTKAGTGTASTLTMDWWRCAQLR